jgi:hypothetical protein
MCVAIVEFDKCKQINDHLGRLQGGTILPSVADVLRTNSRAADLVARFGGDEFVLVHEANGGTDCGAGAAQCRGDPDPGRDSAHRERGPGQYARGREHCEGALRDGGDCDVRGETRGGQSRERRLTIIPRPERPFPIRCSCLAPPLSRRVLDPSPGCLYNNVWKESTTK